MTYIINLQVKKRMALKLELVEKPKIKPRFLVYESYLNYDYSYILSIKKVGKVRILKRMKKAGLLVIDKCPKFNHSAVLQRLEKNEKSTLPEVIKLCDALSDSLGCDRQVGFLLLGEFVRNGGANQNCSDLTIQILVPLSLLNEGFKTLELREDLKQKTGKSRKEKSNSEPLYTLEVTLKQLKKVFKSCHFNEFNAEGKRITLRFLANSIGEEIILAGLQIQNSNPYLDLSGDLKKDVFKTVAFDKKRDPNLIPIRPEEMIPLASYANGIKDLNGLVGSTRVEAWLKSNWKKKNSASPKKKMGKKVAFRVRSHMEQIKTFSKSRFLRDLVRYNIQKESQNKPKMCRVEIEAYRYLSDSSQTGLPLFSDIESKKGPSQINLVWPKFMAYLQLRESNLAGIVKSNDLTLFTNKTKYLLKEALINFWCQEEKEALINCFCEEE